MIIMGQWTRGEFHSEKHLIIKIMKCFALKSFNLSCQTEHTKINNRLNFN